MNSQDHDMCYHMSGTFSDVAVDATLMQRIGEKSEMAAKVVTQLGHGHMHVDFTHINTMHCFIHLFFSYFHLPLSPSFWVLLHPHMLSLTLVSLQVHVVCGSAFALNSCSTHKASEAFVLADA